MSQPSATAELLALIEFALAASPGRSDLWMMRFSALKALGAAGEFARAVEQAQSNPAIQRQIDWIELRSLWGELAPGHPFPEPGTPLPPVAASLFWLPSATPLRRFQDIAARIAAPELAELARAYAALSVQPGFLDEFARRTGSLLRRPTPLEISDSLSAAAGPDMRVFLKREDRRGVTVESEHAAAHCYIASRLGRPCVITGNDVDRHSLELATMARFFELECTVVLRPEDFEAKAGLVADLRALGAAVEPNPERGMIGTDPREGALHLWRQSTGATHLVLSLGMAPQPHTTMANAFQGILGHETEAQYLATAGALGRPRTVVAAVGSESDPIGFVLPYLNRREVRVAYAEPEPGGPAAWKPSDRHAAYNGQLREHTWLCGVGRIDYFAVSDGDAAAGRARLLRDGIEVGLEDARAVVLTLMLAQDDTTPRDFLVLVG